MTPIQPLGRGRPSSENSQAKRGQILAVARNLFIERGYRSVTMRDVAEQSRASTRTVYNHYSDKLRLFKACLDFGSEAFPVIVWSPAAGVEPVLRRFAADLVHVLSTDSSIRMSRLVYREGAEFPELVDAAQDVERRHLIEPVARYLERVSLAEEGDAEVRAKLFLALAIADWERTLSYRLPALDRASIETHAEVAVRLFLDGARRM